MDGQPERTRTIGVVTVGRSDYGIYLPILRLLRAATALRPHLYVAGTHLAERFGLTVREIEADGFTVGDRIDTLPETDDAAAVAAAMGRGLAGFARAFARHPPDIVLALGDRFEMCAAVAAAVPLALPVAHLHGGELTEGAMDDCFRHAITKMSHLHFVATERYRERVLQMGEEPWRVTVSGAPALDHWRDGTPLERAALEAAIGLPLEPPPLVVTYHPETRAVSHPAQQIAAVLAALEDARLPVVFTYPNTDMGADAIIRAIETFCGTHPRCALVKNLGTRAYFSLLRRAAAMVGNSSSGIIEAASCELPVVNVGDRQRGRERAANVLDVPCAREAIGAAIRQAVADAFRASLHDLRNPYGDGHAAERIVRVLQTVALGQELIRKPFVDRALSVS